MRKHNTMRMAYALGVAVMLSFSLFSGTLARYASSGSGTDMARAAKWVINAGTGGNLKAISTNGTDSMSFDLFNKVLDTKGVIEDKRVKAGGDETIVAPGTWGYVDLKIQNLSEVAADYAINLDAEGESSLPLDYAILKIDGFKNEIACPDASTVTWKADLSEVKVASTSDTLNHTDGNVLYRVYWKWDYMRANKDQEDTDIGRNGRTTQTIKATVKATQAD